VANNIDKFFCDFGNLHEERTWAGLFGCTEALGNGFRIKPGMTATSRLEEDSGPHALHGDLSLPDCAAVHYTETIRVEIQPDATHHIRGIHAPHGFQ
jgi:hypothetical protein